MLWQVSDNMDIAREDSEEQKIAAIQARIRTGDEIWVKVIDVKAGDRYGRGPKVGCSIKACERNRSSNRDTPDIHRRRSRSFSSASSDYDGGPHLLLTRACMRLNQAPVSSVYRPVLQFFDHLTIRVNHLGLESQPL